MIYSVSEIGDMVDFLKSYPFVSMEDYMWKLSIPMIRIMSMDSTHIHYKSDRNKAKVLTNPMELVGDFGVPVFGTEN